MHKILSIMSYLEGVAVQSLRSKDGVPDAVSVSGHISRQSEGIDCATYSHCREDREEVPKVSSQ